jgi:uncharacterized protein involved in cysteine biosynthesis
MKRSFHFSAASVTLFVISLIPVLGSIVTAVGHTYLVSQSLGDQLLEVYTKDYHNWGVTLRENYVKRNKWIIFGYALPFTFILSIPIVGPFLLGFAQAGAADLLVSLNKLEKAQATPRQSGSSSS